MIALIKRILNFTGNYKKKIEIAFVLTFFKSFLSKASMMLAFITFTAFMNKTADKNMCINVALAVLTCVIVQIVLEFIVDKLQGDAGYKVFAEKRMLLGKHLQKMPMGYFTEGNMGKISSVLSSDMIFIEENCMMSLGSLMNNIFSQILMIAFLFYFNVLLGIVSLLFLSIVLIVGKGMEKESMEDSAKRQKQTEKLTDSVIDFAEGIGIIKTYNMLGDKSKELSDNFKKMCDTNIHFEMANTPWQRGLKSIYSIAVAVVVGVAIWLQSQGKMNASYLIGLMLFAFDFFAPVKALYDGSAKLTVMNSCLDRIESLLNEVELNDNGTEIIPEARKGQKEIEFRNVGFAYGDKEILHDISFGININEMYALVGPSGSGKSTIANLVARFWDVKSGQILVRGKDIRDIPLNELMNYISMVFQRVYLFQDTIYNNISMGRPNATKQEVIEAAKKARCYDFIIKLPDGFDTVVGEGGASLSGGEKQRISIARCILKDAPIVILDEATASVDADNESYIQQAISELCRGKTLIVIAHRLKTIQNAKQILVIAEGKIKERGTHEELIKNGGVYKKFISKKGEITTWKVKGKTVAL